MRQAQKTNRARGRGNRKGGGGGNNINRVYDSAGPEGKVRGTPQQIVDKYLSLARDAQTSGDRVTAENFLQHAEHYQRILLQASGAYDEKREQPSGDGDDEDGMGFGQQGSGGNGRADGEANGTDQGLGDDGQGGRRNRRGRRGGDRGAGAQGHENGAGSNSHDDDAGDGSGAPTRADPLGGGMATIDMDGDDGPDLLVQTEEMQPKRPRRRRPAKEDDAPAEAAEAPGASDPE